MKLSRSENGFPDSCLGLVPRPSRLKRTVCGFLPSNSVRRLLFVNPSRPRFLCRGEQLLLTFFGMGSRQLKLNRASLVILAQNRTVDCFSNCRSSVEISVKTSRSQIACPDSGLGLVPGDFSIAKGLSQNGEEHLLSQLTRLSVPRTRMIAAYD